MWQRLGIILFLLLSLLPAYSVNQWLQKVIAPRMSFLRFLVYILTAFALVFAYTFVVVWCIGKLFPLPKR
jgi:hypothetical protein